PSTSGCAGWMKPPLPGAFIQPAQPLVDGQRGDHLRTRRDVADLLREQAGPLLIDQAGRLALQQRLLEALAGGLAPVDLAHHAAAGEGEAVAAHRRVGREWEAVGDGQRYV